MRVLFWMRYDLKQENIDEIVDIWSSIKIFLVLGGPGGSPG